MTFDVRGPGQAGAYDASQRPAPAPRPSAAGFARVYELEEARARRAADPPAIAGDRIPAEVWDEVDAAARLVEQLHAEGRSVMFDTDRLNGTVVASLLEPDGAIAPVELQDAIDPAALRTSLASPLGPARSA
jgi:hypothetical protein